MNQLETIVSEVRCSECQCFKDIEQILIDTESGLNPNYSLICSECVIREYSDNDNFTDRFVFLNIGGVN